MNYTVFMQGLKTIIELVYGAGSGVTPPTGKDLLVSFSPIPFCGLRAPSTL